GARVLLCEAPVVEGAVAAAVAARLGGSVEDVATEARRGLAGKVAHLGGDAPAGADGPAPSPDRAGDWRSARVTVAAAHGLHARPAGRVVAAASGVDADVEVEN